MYPSMTVRAECNNVVGMIWSAVTPPVKMMDLQKRFSVFIEEWCLLVTTLANTVCLAQGVLPHDHGAWIRSS